MYIEIISKLVNIIIVSIPAYLLFAKNDIEVWTMVNERDEYGRNGLMYLLIHIIVTTILLVIN